MIYRNLPSPLQKNSFLVLNSESELSYIALFSSNMAQLAVLCREGLAPFCADCRGKACPEC